MRKVLLFLVLISGISFAQKPDTTLNRFFPSMVAGLNISQISFKDWTKGGDNTLTWTLTGDFNVRFKTLWAAFSSRLKGTYGRSKIGDNDFRTNDNDLYFDIVAALRVGWAVDPYFSNTIRTQLTSGWNYAVLPAQQITDFFDPGYVTQALGFTFDKVTFVKTRLGIAAQEVFTNNFRRYSDNPATAEQEAFKLETGIESVSDIDLTIDKNVALKSMLRLFSRFESLETWDVRWDNVLTAKVNSWLNVNLSFLMIYEKAQSIRTQMKQALQIGIVYAII